MRTEVGSTVEAGKAVVGGERLYTTWFRSTSDGKDHAVTDEDFANPLLPGQYRAICDHVVDIAPATAPPGPVCRDCLSVLRGHQLVLVPGSARHRKAGFFSRLFGLATRSSGVVR
ncbi:hypothetical protein [Amycolatopsis anabasis]|uniref:hypothetical protein n=1 Tax=Amycolatopsis anabasis TaxID=1840409 RepID=UPI00131CB3F2|nr:hypothetical protein [Amycolatopsis anabasis]